MPKTLHYRLFLGISLGWIALLVVTLLTVYGNKHELIDDTNQAHLTYEASLIAKQVEGSIHNRQRTLARIASTDDADALSLAPEATRAFLKQHQGALALFSRIGVISKDGTLIATHPYEEKLQGLDISHRQYFKTARVLKRPTISEAFISQATGQPLILMTHPLTNDRGTHIGILIGTVEVASSTFFDRIDDVRIGKGGFATLLAADGTILSHPDRSRLMSKINSPPIGSDLDLALLGWEGSGKGQLSDGASALHAFAQVKGPSWVVHVAMPVSQAALPTRNLLTKLLLIGLLAATLMLPFLFFLLQIALKPLHDLEAQILSIRQGESRQVSLSTASDEIQQLASTFNNLEHERQQASSELKERSAFLNSVLQASPIGIFITDEHGQLIYRNKALGHITGYPSGSLLPSPLSTHIHPDDRSDYDDLWQHAMESRTDFRRQARYINADGHILWIEVLARGVWSNEAFLGYAGTVKDITQRREEDAVRLWQAEHDPLTDLLNRRGFERRLEEAMTVRRMRQQPAVLLMFDLDHFKPINDDGGHGLGDEMLIKVSQAMAEVFRRGDHLARPGGDEFAVILDNCSLENGLKLAERLRATVAQRRVFANGRAYAVTISLGLTEILPNEPDIIAPITRADQASYDAKRKGRDQIAEST